MTSDENPALHAAGLLADPADRDKWLKYQDAAQEVQRELDTIRFLANGELVEDEDGAPYPGDVQDAIAHSRLRAERAEAEVAALKKHNQTRDNTMREYITDNMALRKKNAELRVTVDRVEGLADELDDLPKGTIRAVHVSRLRAALDGAGESE